MPEVRWNNFPSALLCIDKGTYRGKVRQLVEYEKLNPSSLIFLTSKIILVGFVSHRSEAFWRSPWKALLPSPLMPVPPRVMRALVCSVAKPCSCPSLSLHLLWTLQQEIEWDILPNSVHHVDTGFSSPSSAAYHQCSSQLLSSRVARCSGCSHCLSDRHQGWVTRFLHNSWPSLSLHAGGSPFLYDGLPAGKVLADLGKRK